MQCWLGLGSNLGDRIFQLQQALTRIGNLHETTLKKRSKVYETEPIGPVSQGKFLNMCASIETTLQPAELLKECLEIERMLGRERTERWGPRTLDIDLLAYEGVESTDPGLTLPHPKLHQRGFVLKPLQDIAPGLIVHGRQVADWLAQTGSEGVYLYSQTIIFESDTHSSPRKQGMHSS